MLGDPQFPAHHRWMSDILGYERGNGHVQPYQDCWSKSDAVEPAVHKTDPPCCHRTYSLTMYNVVNSRGYGYLPGLVLDRVPARCSV